MQEVGEPTASDVSFSFSVAMVLDHGRKEYVRLLREYEERGTNADMRAASLGLARRTAGYQRLGFIMGESLATLSEDLAPQAALAILRQLSYSLVALGREEPDEATLLSEDELEALLREPDLNSWLEGVLTLIPKDWSPP